MKKIKKLLTIMVLSVLPFAGVKAQTIDPSTTSPPVVNFVPYFDNVSATSVKIGSSNISTDGVNAMGVNTGSITATLNLLTRQNQPPWSISFERDNVTTLAFLGLTGKHTVGQYGLRLLMNDNGVENDAFYVAPNARIGIGNTDPVVQFHMHSGGWSGLHGANDGIQNLPSTGNDVLLVGPYEFDGTQWGAIRTSGAGAGFYFANRDWDGVTSSYGKYFTWFAKGEQDGIAILSTNGNKDLMTVNGVSGKVGIGYGATANLGAKLNVNADNTSGIFIDVDNTNNSSSSEYNGMSINLNHYSDYGWGIAINANRPLTKAIEVIDNSNPSSPKSNFKVWGNGDVWITDASLILGTTIGHNFKVDKDGFVIARQVDIHIDPIPDYVFHAAYDKDSADKYKQNGSYRMMELNELEKYVSKNRHLPGIKSSADYEKKGTVNVGELQIKLLEKVEELTLYNIQLKKELDELKASLNDKQTKK